MNSEIFVKKKLFCTFLQHISYCEQHRKLLDFLCKMKFLPKMMVIKSCYYLFTFYVKTYLRLKMPKSAKIGCPDGDPALSEPEGPDPWDIEG